MISKKWNLVCFIPDLNDPVEYQLFRLNLITFMNELKIDKIFIYSDHNLSELVCENNLIKIFPTIDKRLTMINTNLMIFPFSLENEKIIEQVVDFSTKLNENEYDDRTITSISLSEILLKNDFQFESICDNIYLKSFINYSDDDIHQIQTNVHELISLKKNIDWKSLIKQRQLNPHLFNDRLIFSKIILHEKNGSLINYANSRYLYYPTLDMQFDNPKHIEHVTFDKINVFHSFNTNNFSDISIDRMNIQSKMYKRFNNKMSGLFVMKMNNSYKIPKFFHHIWIDTNPVDSYIKAWKYVLKSPWEYKIWNVEDIINEANDNWKSLFKNKTDKLFIASMIILMKYGGVIVDSFSLPQKIIPDEILSHEMIIGFLDEYQYGLKLSYRFIASIKMDDIFYNNIYSILSNNESIDTYLLSNKCVTVYPSYYFNPKLSGLPSDFIKFSVCIHLWKK